MLTPEEEELADRDDRIGVRLALHWMEQARKGGFTTNIVVSALATMFASLLLEMDGQPCLHEDRLHELIGDKERMAIFIDSVKIKAQMMREKRDAGNAEPVGEFDEYPGEGRSH